MPTAGSPKEVSAGTDGAYREPTTRRDLLRPAGQVRIYSINGGRACMFTHLFPTHRNDHDNPESFLIVAGAILTVFVILVALAVMLQPASPLLP
jgi:hypothetical protein